MTDAILAMDLSRLSLASQTFAWVVGALSALDAIILADEQVVPVERALEHRGLRLERCEGGGWLVLGRGGVS